jgi:hypothetical protein
MEIALSLGPRLGSTYRSKAVPTEHEYMKALELWVILWSDGQQ